MLEMLGIYRNSGSEISCRNLVSAHVLITANNERLREVEKAQYTYHDPQNQDPQIQAYTCIGLYDFTGFKSI